MGNYKKLIAGLCKTWKVNLIRVSSRSDLGKMAGLYKNDASGVARKVRPCSCVVVKKWPEDVPDLKISIDADLKTAISFLNHKLLKKLTIKGLVYKLVIKKFLIYVVNKF